MDQLLEQSSLQLDVTHRCCIKVKIAARIKRETRGISSPYRSPPSSGVSENGLITEPSPSFPGPAFGCCDRGVDGSVLLVWDFSRKWYADNCAGSGWNGV